MDLRDIVICALLTTLGAAILVQPMLRYICVGWKAKRKEIMDGLSPSARHEYFLMFSGSEPPPDKPGASLEFEKLYERWYGRRYFCVPAVLLATVAVITAASVVLSYFGKGFSDASPLFHLPKVAIAALAGAYLWVVNDHIGRARRLDFSPADVMWAVLRIVISIPMAYALAALAKDEAAAFVAFALGAFPLATLLSILRRLGGKQLGLQADADDAGDGVSHLQGVNKSIVERLDNEDITTVTQIAYCDPVKLTMRSNLSFDFIIDCMNQALAWMYFEDLMNDLRPLGMRGACEIRDLVEDIDYSGTDPDRKSEHDAALKVLPMIAERVKQSPETLLVAFRQIADDPYTIFLREIWE